MSTSRCRARGQDLARALEEAERSRTLFLLDGLDEISQDLSGESDMFRFLHGAVDHQPNVVITSRPYGRLPTALGALDLELETVGFYPDQVNEYLQKNLPDLQETIKVQTFLQQHQLIQGLVRIPIQLDALCFTWNDGVESRTKLDTMTAVYQAIAQRSMEKGHPTVEEETRRGAGNRRPDTIG